jgi:DNA-binding transcriptional ArsR family regulator
MQLTEVSMAAILDWLAATGAASTIELEVIAGLSRRALAARLRSLEQAGLVRSTALLRGEPALHVLTRAGLRAAGRPELESVAISAASFGHHLALARAAVALRAAGERVGGEHELRAFERLEGRPLASAAVGLARSGEIAWHRPDLVCWRPGLPVAVEIELTVKAPERLRGIVRGWARSRLVEGVVYYATPAAARAVSAAVRRESAESAVAVLALELAGDLAEFRSTSSIPSAT